MNGSFKSIVDKRLSAIRAGNGLESLPVRYRKKEKARLFRFAAITAAVCICLLFSVTAIAVNAAKAQAGEFYKRYLSPEDMAVADASAAQYGAEVYFQGLKSDDPYSRYFSINKLAEYYNDDGVREKAIRALTPFVNDENPKLAGAASFTLSILNKTFDNPNIYRLSDGSLLFTLFNGYSDYGSYHELWMIKDGRLDKFYSFHEPSMYVTSILLSPDKSSFAVTTCSNKSTYLVVFDMKNARISPELVGSARIRLAGEKGYDVWQRMDNENYSGIEALQWRGDTSLSFRASLSYYNTEKVEQAQITYDVASGTMKIG